MKSQSAFNFSLKKKYYDEFYSKAWSSKHKKKDCKLTDSVVSWRPVELELIKKQTKIYYLAKNNFLKRMRRYQDALLIPF